MPSSESNGVSNGANASEVVASDIFIRPVDYPKPRRDESIVDDFHGTKVADPYRWMENPDAAETQAFVEECNKISEPFLNASSVRETMRARLTELWDYEKYSCSSKRGKYYYYLQHRPAESERHLPANEPGRSWEGLPRPKHPLLRRHDVHPPNVLDGERRDLRLRAFGEGLRLGHRQVQEGQRRRIARRRHGNEAQRLGVDVR
ncbi:hypothetical protein L596_016552 [Steinernema carpocapsae]|uniref:Peptidase S9A N-terminal domain-containing protein n=1 Tax=Steinernema carpocapsae TaxID=34508 RepID=A0A4U5NIE4_STECR|nr:hypothetical protein L596_016552 [Steinernema carpocapsae]